MTSRKLVGIPGTRRPVSCCQFILLPVNKDSGLNCCRSTTLRLPLAAVGGGRDFQALRIRPDQRRMEGKTPDWYSPNLGGPMPKHGEFQA